jgi:hypothetical protein
MTVQQDDRRAVTAVAHPERRLADVDLLERKAFEERHDAPVPSTLAS